MPFYTPPTDPYSSSSSNSATAVSSPWSRAQHHSEPSSSFLPPFFSHNDPDPSQEPPTRLALFSSPQPHAEGSMGEIQLAFNIFKVFGTPNDDIWPGFSQLPDAGRVVWREVEGCGLKGRLNLNFGHDAQDIDMTVWETEERAAENHILDFLSRLLVYPPERRVPAKEAMSLDFFASPSSLYSSSARTGSSADSSTTRPWLLLPPSYPPEALPETLRSSIRHSLELEQDNIQMTLGDLFLGVLGRTSCS
ncbi:hypothetical protein D9758_012019 [Tetrapyrgos nigripes]|uniref:Uncharacterized protein n=1 Tax=Tetrapyrgos nigripes TaxID=182062 RepID=A0A8H5CPL3_9AGAR|nr:hypothetical protein D9758_012019 [Tetrapyrgos nigripes]